MIDQIKKVLLDEFKKSNKERREKMAVKYGYASSEEYLKYLTGSPVVVNEVAKVKPTIHNVVILDASGSMTGSKFENALSGINEGIEALKKDTNVIHTQSIISFSDDIITQSWMTNISEMKRYTDKTRGSTALYQAMGETINKLVKTVGRNDKVLINVFTDGGENASNKHWKDGKAIASLIKEVQNKNFTVTFVGTKQDVERMNNLGIDVSNSLTYDGSAVGMKMSMSKSNNARTLFSVAVSAGEDVSKGFYTKVSGTLD